MKIIKKGTNNFWHWYNNDSKKVAISDFEIVLDAVLNTFVIVFKNGANVPQIALSVNDIEVIDETSGSIVETFPTVELLRTRLVALGYTPFISSGGGSGTQNLNQVLAEGNTTGGEFIIISDGDAVLLDNGSKLKKGTTNAGNGGNNGIAFKCSLDYEFKWEAGRLYIMEQDGVTIRESKYNFGNLPSATDDTSKGFTLNSRWILDNGDIYICEDATIDTAIWTLQVNAIPNLQQVTDIGNTTDKGIESINTTGNAKFNISNGDYSVLNFESIDLSISNYGQVIANVEPETGINFKKVRGLSNTNYQQDETAIILSSNDNNVTISPNSLRSEKTIRTDEDINFSGLGVLSSNATTLQNWDLPDESGTIALVSDIPTKTSDLINDGDDGNAFISLLDLPSNLILYPTTAASDISGYSKLVTDIHDPSYNTTAVDVSTGVISTTAQLISSLATSASVIVGNPGVFNITTIGNISRTAGTGTAEFFFRVYKRDSSGVETFITQSANTIPVINTGYSEFSATGLWDDGIFLVTDRIVLKFYANRITGGSNPTYNFQFGGISPVRSLVPIPLSVVPSIGLDGLNDVTITTPLDAQVLGYENSTSLWKNKSIATWLGFTPANDASVVHLAGVETITGLKTFTDLTTFQGTTQTGSSANGILNLLQTWNTTGIVKAILLNITDTASNAVSKLLDIQLGGNSLVSTYKTITRFNQSIYIGGSSTSDGASAFIATQGGSSYSGGGNIKEFYTNKTLTTTGTSSLNWSGFEFNTSINQSAGSTGITRGLYINPALTSAIDFRAIEATKGSIVLPYQGASATYPIKTSDYLVDFTTGTFTATLPTAVGCVGKTYVLKNSGTGVITIATTSSQTIDGMTTNSLIQYASITVVSNGTNWIKI